jgi:hypothetical protein
MIILNYFCLLIFALSFAVHAENKPVDLPYVSTAPTAPEPTGIKVTNKVDAKSCHFDDVSAVASKAEPGTQVNIPAGNCDWGLHSLKVGPGVYIRGAGKTQTIISRNTPPEPTNPDKTGAGNALMTIDCAPGKPNALSNLTLQGNGRGGEPQNGSDQRDNGLKLNGFRLVNGTRSSSPCENFRVFNTKFSGFGFSAINITGDPTKTSGVIFNNDFLHNYFYQAINKGVILGYGVVVYGDSSWPNLALGTADNVFIENNFMLGNRHHVASNHSSRYVFRYNTAITTSATKSHYALDVHGRLATERTYTGSRQYEIYGNIIEANLPQGEGARTAAGIRGGDGVIFNNTIGPQFRFGIELMVEGSYDGQGKLNCKSAPDTISDLYIWDNKLNMAHVEKNGVTSVCSDIVKPGRDFFMQQKKGYTPYTYPHPLRQ